MKPKSRIKAPGKRLTMTYSAIRIANGKKDRKDIGPNGFFLILPTTVSLHNKILSPKGDNTMQ
jgi:hypothetical protein